MAQLCLFCYYIILNETGKQDRAAKCRKGANLCHFFMRQETEESEVNGHQRQREQSARMIEDALFALMEEKEFGQITVSEIVKRADVARRTFYRLYEGKEDVLHRCLKRLCEIYCESFPPMEKYELRKIAEDFFSFWYAHRKLLLLLHRCGMEDMLFCEIGRVSPAVVRKRIGSDMLKKLPESEVFASYSAGGFLMLLHCWIAGEMKEPPESYAEKVSSALRKFIQPAAEGAGTKNQ